MEKLNIAGRLVGPGEPPYIAAEIGANHNGDMTLCRKMIDAARDRCRVFADAVASPERLASYVRALNSLPPRYIWWWSVANPELEDLWKS